MSLISRLPFEMGGYRPKLQISLGPGDHWFVLVLQIFSPPPPPWGASTAGVGPSWVGGHSGDALWRDLGGKPPLVH
jgi:hypothetical protein